MARRLITEEPMGEMTTQPTMGMDANTLKMMFQLLLMSDPSTALKQATKFGSALNILELEKPSKEEEEEKTTKEEAERIVRALEDRYFFSERGMLSYGRVEGGKETVSAYLTGSNPELSQYLAFRASIRPKFVKAMGDVGNFSLPEQQAAVKDVPTGMNTPEEAQLYFAGLRERMGLPARKLSIEGKKATEVSKPVSAAVASQPQEMNIPFGALGQLVGGRLPFPYNIAGAGAIGGLGTALPLTGERLGIAARGETPSYNQQLAETASGMGQVGKTIGINALLQAILSPVKTIGGIRDIAAGTQAGLEAGVPELLKTKRMGWAPKYEKGAPFEQVQAGTEQARGIQQYLGTDFPVTALLDKLLSGTIRAGQAARTGAGIFGKSAIRALPWLGGGALLGKYGGVF